MAEWFQGAKFVTNSDIPETHNNTAKLCLSCQFSKVLIHIHAATITDTRGFTGNMLGPLNKIN